MAEMPGPAGPTLQVRDWLRNSFHITEPKLSPVIPEAERSGVELTRSRIGALLTQALASPIGIRGRGDG
jgi:hypothetical protein